MTIRNMTVHDIPAVKALGDRAPELSVTEGNSPFWEEARLRSWIEAHQDIMLVAEEDGRVIGFQITTVHLPSQVGYLSDLVVDERFRGQGIGSVLVSETIVRMKTLGITYLYALTQANNDKIHGLLQKYGFAKGEKMIWLDKHL